MNEYWISIATGGQNKSTSRKLIHNFAHMVLRPVHQKGVGLVNIMT